MWEIHVDEELWACFIDRRKGFDRVNWTKLMQIISENGIDWRERRLINLYDWTKVRQMSED